VRIAVCEAGPLRPDRDAGSRAVTDLLAGLNALGHDAQAFIESRSELGAALDEFAPEVLFVSRPGLFARVHRALRRFSAPLVYLAHDLHFVRLGLHEPLDPARAAGSSVMRVIERECMTAADLVVLPTEAEAARARDEFPGARVRSMRYFVLDAVATAVEPPATARLVFVGGSFHAPNLDAVRWTAEQAWDRLRVAEPAAELVVAGDWPQTDRMEAAGIAFTGPLPDPELDAAIDAARLGLVPLRFGAGMKRKTLHLLSRGRPVLGTVFATEGLDDAAGETPGVVRIASVDDLVSGVRLLRDEHEWRSRSEAGLAFVRDAFSPAAYRADLAATVEATSR